MKSKLLSLQLHRTKEGLHNGSVLASFTNIFRIAFYQNSTQRLLLKVCEISEHWCSHFSLFKITLERGINHI